jgi:hypothetical protein
LAKGETSGLFGPPGSGKSAIETDIAIHLAQGLDFRGHKTKVKCGTVYFAFERADLTKRRHHAYKLRDELDDLPISVASNVVNLMDPKCVGIIGDTIKAHEDHYSTECGFVVLDTSSKGIAVGGDEDKAKDTNRALGHLRDLHLAHKLHLSLVGHTGKDESRGQRGSNAAPGDYDLHIQLSGGDIKTATAIRANDQPLVLGHDEDGDELVTWIVDDAEVQAVAKEGGRKMSRNMTTMFSILFDAKELSVTEWFENTKEASIGVKRRADLTDIKSALYKQELKPYYQSVPGGAALKGIRGLVRRYTLIGGCNRT